MKTHTERYSTAKGSTADGTYAPDSKGDLRKIYNIQLGHWIDAKKLYRLLQQNPDNLNPKNIDSLIMNLGASLTTLFGVNYHGKGHVPSLFKFVQTYLKNKGWDLEKDDPQLYMNFLKLDKVHKDLSKHISYQKTKQLEEIELVEISSYMQTTRDVWLWYLGKQNPYANDEYLVQFNEVYK